MKTRPSWNAQRAEQQRRRRERKRQQLREQQGRDRWQPADLAFYRIARMNRRAA